MPLCFRMISSNLYVNQARVSFTFELQSSEGKKQFLYLIGMKFTNDNKIMPFTSFCHIDSVLEPLVPKDEKVEDFVDIKAKDLLMNSDTYK